MPHSCAAGSDAPGSFGEGLLEGLREVVAWKRGEVALPVRVVEPMPPEGDLEADEQAAHGG